jgi:hypothetical protein
MSKENIILPKKDVFPKRESEFKPWSVKFMNMTALKGVEWHIDGFSLTHPDLGGISIDSNCMFAELQGLHGTYLQKYDIAMSEPTRTKDTTRAKNEAKAAFESLLRKFIRAYIADNPHISNAEREQLEISVHKEGHTTIAPANYTAELDIRNRPSCRIAVHYHILGVTGHAIPYGMKGLLIAYSVLDHQPINQSELAITDIATSSPHVLSFPLEDRAKIVYISACWVNLKGEKGPWSEIKSAVIA